MSLKNALKEALQIMLDRKRNKYNDRFYEERSGNPTPNNSVYWSNTQHNRLPYNYNRPTHWGRIQNPQLHGPGEISTPYFPPSDSSQGFDPSHGYRSTGTGAQHYGMPKQKKSHRRKKF